MKISALALTLLPLALATAAHAAIIAPNSFSLATPVTAVTGTQIDSSTHTFTGLDSTSSVVFTGTETSKVFSGDTGNTLGGLTYVYTLSNDAISKDAINRITLSGFSGFSADAGYVTGTGIVPVTIDRSTDGAIIGFGFPGAEILQGTSTVQLVIRTNATSDLADTMSISDGGTGTTASFGPAKTPEPATLGTLALVGTATLRRRARR